LLIPASTYAFVAISVEAEGVPTAERVIAGVVVEFATLPCKLLALTTLTDVTVPETPHPHEVDESVILGVGNIFDIVYLFIEYG
jgi:hypothetical protein